jgi:hypothetical protein
MKFSPYAQYYGIFLRHGLGERERPLSFIEPWKIQWILFP